MSNQEGRAQGLEVALGRIEEITRLLDRSDLELDEALALYEEGVHLLRTAEGFLSRAEERIHQLRQVGEEYVVEPLAGEP
jgi:exodeoxyribonuclease VII small subunit